MKKHGQFYLLAVIMMIGVFVALLLIQNHSTRETNISLDELREEIEIERRQVLDYSANVAYSVDSTRTKIINFSDSYIARAGSKDVIFLFGNDGDITMNGALTKEGIFSYEVDGGGMIALGAGPFTEEIGAANDVVIYVDGFSYDFEFQSIQNIYYLIRHDYNKETHIISG